MCFSARASQHTSCRRVNTVLPCIPAPLGSVLRHSPRAPRAWRTVPASTHASGLVLGAPLPPASLAPDHEQQVAPQSRAVPALRGGPRSQPTFSGLPVSLGDAAQRPRDTQCGPVRPVLTRRPASGRWCAVCQFSPVPAVCPETIIDNQDPHFLLSTVVKLSI